MYKREIVYFTIAHKNDSEGHHISIQLFVLTARSAILLKTDGSWKLRIMFSIKNTLRSNRLTSKECRCNKICIYEDISMDYFIFKINYETICKQVLGDIYGPRSFAGVGEVSRFEFLQ